MYNVILDEELGKEAVFLKNWDKLMPTFRRFANLWQKNIVIHNLRDFEVLKTENSAILHLYLFLGDIRGAEVDLPKSIFGYLPEELMILKDILFRNPSRKLSFMGGLKYLLGRSEDNLFKGPEGHCLAEVESSQIKVFINLAKFSEEAAKDILEMMLMFAIPKAFPKEKSQRLTAALNQLKGGAFRDDKMKKFKSNFVHYLSSQYQNSIRELDGSLISKQVELLGLEAKRIQNSIKIRELEEAKASILEKLKNEEGYGNQFDQLMKIDGVRAVLIENGQLAVYTQEIVKEIGGASYNLGVFRIQFDHEKRDHKGIRFGQYKRGPYIHPFIRGGDSDVCFGNHNDFGLNLALDKLMSDFDAVPLVNFVINFLKFEEQKPLPDDNFLKWLGGQRNQSLESKEINIDYQPARKSYIQFMKGTMFSIFNRTINEALVVHEKAEEKLRGEYLAVRIAIQLLASRLAALKQKLNQSFWERLMIDLENLKQYPAIRKIQFRRGLRIWLFDERINDWPALVWLENDRLPWVISSKAFSQRINESHGLVENDDISKSSQILSDRDLIAAVHWIIKELFGGRQ